MTKPTDLRISSDLALPIEAVTQKFAWLGRTGSGKSYGATKLAELMLAAGAQVVALDPVGVWWGLRTGAGFSIPVFGGLHGDIPLDPHAGALIADLIVDRNLCAVLDVSQMLSSEQQRFATAFITQLFQRKKAAPSAMHLFLEEAQEFVPQNVSSGETLMVHAFERLIKLGRNFGIGASLISQRPQEVNKKALNQTECLFAFQMTGPQERKAIESWVAEKGVTDNIISELPRLKVGEPHVWSPQWLGVSKTIRIANKKTADVSSTPKPGEKPVAPATLSPVDLEELREKLAATIAKAKEEDPRELRKRIAELQQANTILQSNAAISASAAKVEIKEVPVLKDGQLAKAERLLEGIAALRARDMQRADELVGKLSLMMSEISGAIERTKIANRQKDLPTSRPAHQSRPQVAPVARPAPVRTVPTPAGWTGSSNGGEIGGGIRRMMIALAQRPGLNARQLGVRASLSSSSGTFGTYLAKLRTNAWLEGDRNGMQLTATGITALGDYTPLPEGQALLDHWLADLGPGSGAARMLQALANAYPRALTKEELGRDSKISHTSGTFGTYLSRLRTLELVMGSKELKASDELFG